MQITGEIHKTVQKKKKNRIFLNKIPALIVYKTSFEGILSSHSQAIKNMSRVSKLYL